MLQIWEEVLEVEKIGTTQNFFELGGNSFLALRLVALVNRRLGGDLPLASLFVGGTVRHMAETLGEQHTAAPAAPEAAVPL